MGSSRCLVPYRCFTGYFLPSPHETLSSPPRNGRCAPRFLPFPRFPPFHAAFTPSPPPTCTTQRTTILPLPPPVHRISVVRSRPDPTAPAHRPRHGPSPPPLFPFPCPTPPPPGTFVAPTWTRYFDMHQPPSTSIRPSPPSRPLVASTPPPSPPPPRRPPLPPPPLPPPPPPTPI